MGQNESSQGQTGPASSSSKNPIAYSSVTQARIIQVLEDENREKEELIKRQRAIILKEKEEKETASILRQRKEEEIKRQRAIVLKEKGEKETSAILRQQKEILENEKKIVLQALEEESFAKKKAIIEKERVVREKERQLKEQEKIIQIQREELEKHKEITKNVLEEVVQRQTKNPPKRFNHQYNFDEQPTSSKVEKKLQSMQIGSKDKFTVNNENKSKSFNKVNDVRQWSNDQKSARHETQTIQNLHFGHKQMFNQPSNFQNPMLNSMAAYPEPYPPFPQSFGQNMTYVPDPRFTNVNVPPPNLPHLTQQSATNIHATNQNSKENSSHRNKVYQKSVSKSDSDRRSMTDDKYDQLSAASSSLKKDEEQDSDSDKSSTSDAKNKSRRRRRYGRNKASTKKNLNANEGAKTEQLDSNAQKSDKRMIGHFQCPQCSKTWKSATTYIGVTQQCARCRIAVVPTKLESMNKHREDLCGKCKELGHNCREKATNKSTKVLRKRENIDDISD